MGSDQSSLWGKNGSLALYGATNMSGSGLPPHGETYLERFRFWFYQIEDLGSYQGACKILEVRVNSFPEAEKLEECLQDIRDTIKVLLGPYHFKMLHDFLLATRLLPPRLVFTYPVSAGGGTARGLQQMFEITGKKTGPKAFAVMLAELTYHVQRQSTSWWASDHLGSVGAALCWQHRKQSASTGNGHANRMEQTSTARWEKELRDLEKHGIKIFGYHTKLGEYFERTEATLSASQSKRKREEAATLQL